MSSPKVLQVTLEPCLCIALGLISALWADRWPIVNDRAGAHSRSCDWPGTVAIFIEIQSGCYYKGAYQPPSFGSAALGALFTPDEQAANDFAV
jgi:hypothetical protein